MEEHLRTCGEVRSVLLTKRADDKGRPGAGIHGHNRNAAERKLARVLVPSKENRKWFKALATCTENTEKQEYDCPSKHRYWSC